jgi:hypothetical protein
LANFPLTLTEARETIAACDAAYLAGSPPPGSKLINKSTAGAVGVAARKLGLTQPSMCHRLIRCAEIYGLYPKWVSALKRKGELRDPLTQPKVWATPAKKRVVIMTAAQDDTSTDQAAWKSLETYAAHRNAEIFVGGFTYQKGLFEDHSVKTGSFSDTLRKYLQPSVVELAPRLIWYGRANILPTASDPLSGWETQTRDAWAIFPHAKIALKSVPVMPGKPGKQIMTTGVVTQSNYVQRNTGQKAEFHHTIGATVAEIAPDGSFFLRQIKTARDGSFQDLDLFVKDGKVSKGPPLEAIVWGDIHHEDLDEEKAYASWGSSDSMLDVLKPKYQFVHDSFGFNGRSHHSIDDPHVRAIISYQQQDSVKKMLVDTARFLANLRREFSNTVHVASNHNIHLEKWLKNPAGAFDVMNAGLWHRLNAEWHDAIEAGDLKFMPHAYALRNSGEPLEDVTFLREGESFTICQATHPIECGLHAHIGPNGSKGSPTSLSKIVERVNCMHTHSPAIRDGAYFGGTSTRLMLPYASRGPGAWHHADTLTYVSGARTIVTHSNGKWRA